MTTRTEARELDGTRTGGGSRPDRAAARGELPDRRRSQKVSLADVMLQWTAARPVWSADLFGW